MHHRIIEAVHKVAADRHRLVIVLGEFGSGKTGLLKDVAAEIGGTYINLNLLLTDKLLTTPRSQHADGVTVQQLIDSICEEASPDGHPLFVDNLEILFSPELGKINPIDTFKRISRQCVVVIGLPTRRQGLSAVYGLVGRDDFMSIPLEDYITIELEPEK
jgi:predicted ATPase